MKTKIADCEDGQVFSIGESREGLYIKKKKGDILAGKERRAL